jgi:hypothetical protein
VSAELRAAGVGHEFAIVANSATRNERREIAAAINMLGSHGASVRVDAVVRETLYCSWNRIVGQSSARCITFWNADDVRFAPALVSGLACLEGDADLVYFPWVEITVRRTTLGGVLERVDLPHVPEFDAELFRSRMYIGPFFLFKRSLVERVGGFDQQFTAAGDFEWAARAASAATFSRCAELAGVFYVDGKGLSATAGHRHVAERVAVRLRQRVYDQLEPVDWRMVVEYLPDWERRLFDAPSSVRSALEAAADTGGQRQAARQLRNGRVPGLRSLVWGLRKAAESQGLRFLLEDGLSRLRSQKS